MPPNTNEPGGQDAPAMQGDAPAAMLQQAQAAAASEQDTSDETSSRRRHMGRDVPASDDHLDVQSELPDHPPPAYGEHFGAIENEQQGFGTKAAVGDDGRVNININQTNTRLSTLLVPALRHQQEIAHDEAVPPPPYIPPSLGGEDGVPPPPPMNVVIHVVGSRGDVQPFVALGKVLKDTYGHRVRLATHPTFQQFVSENGLEFFSIGGDPAQLMAFMVKNPGLMPGFDSIRTGDVGNRRKEVAEYLKGCWRSCFESGDGLGPAATDNTVEDWASQHPDDASSKPFVADCIIANPPSFAHAHVAEKLGIPLHIMFTMPYSPTQAFPHPLANIQSSNADPHLTNYISYALIDMLTWQGLGDVINRFRQKTLGLEPMSLMWAPGMLQRLNVPHTYCWSPALIPKPKDWGKNVSISGFFFLNLATNYTPAPDLKAFLDAGPPPVYIGFGSIVLDDPNAMTELIFEAVKTTGQRVLLSKGWGGMGAEEMGVPEGVFMLGNVPHDWLFERVSCVVHHGGAGTTAAGITAGKPTVVVPFFGDQPFWGSMVARAGAGPEPLPHKELTGEKLADAINFCLKPESQERAHELAAKIAKEKGSDVGAQSFHQMLDVDKLRCNIAPSHAAVWRLKRTQVRLSALAACTLANEGLLDFNDLKLFRAREYETDDGPWDPITGASTALIGTMSQMMMGFADFPIETMKALKIHPDAVKKQKKPTDDTTESSTSGDTATLSSNTSGQTEALSRTSTGLTDATLTSSPVTPGSSRTPSTFNFQESLERVKSPDSLQPRSSSLADTLKGQLKDAKNRSNSRSGEGSQSGSGGGGSQSQQDYMGTAVDTGKGVHKILSAGFKSPMDFSMALAKGFHNAPKMWGDETVRKTEPVSDFRSGLKVAGKEFGYGLYDGIGGFFTQPVKGAQKEGAAGFVKGFGKGIGGIMMKPAAAIWALPGYTMKGVYKEMQLQKGSSVQNYIIAARTAQGFEEWNQASPEERRDIVVRWQHLQKDIKKKKNPDEIMRDTLEEQRRKYQEQMKKGQRWSQDFRTKSEEKRRSWMGRSWSSGGSGGNEEQAGASGAGQDPEAVMLNVGSTHAAAELDSTSAAPSQDDFSNDDVEEAIRVSVRETSKGDPEEDAAVERAIRASMAELQRSREERAQLQQADAEEEEDEDLKRALQASAAEAQQGRGKTDPLYDAELEEALAQSLKEQRQQRSDEAPAIQIHDHSSTPAQPPSYDPGHLAGTTQREYEAQQATQPGEKTQQEKTEEQVVMEYVKKQSALEEEHRQQGKAPQKDEDDEELKKAMEESLRGKGQQGEASGT